MLTQIKLHTQQSILLYFSKLHFLLKLVLNILFFIPEPVAAGQDWTGSTTLFASKTRC